LSTQCEFRSRLTSRATQGTSKRWRIGDRLLLVTFLGEARKVTSCRAAPGEVDFVYGHLWFDKLTTNGKVWRRPPKFFRTNP